MATVKHRSLTPGQAAKIDLAGNFGAVKVTNLDGGGELYLTTNGTTEPGVGAADCYVLPAAICGDEFPDETPGDHTVVWIICATACRISVRGV